MRRGVILAIILIFAGASVNADEIILKKTFFGGWRYSTDGAKYQRVGILAKGLRAQMAGNEIAQSEMHKYAGYKTWSLITGVSGGILLGYSLIEHWDEDRWDDPSRTMYITSIPLCIAAVFFEEMSASKLQKAVRIYNGQEKTSALPAPGVYASRDGALGIGLTWKF